jgi:hypothetical protein
MNTVPQCLHIHVANTRCFGAVHAIKHRRKRKKAAALVAVLAAFGEPANICDKWSMHNSTGGHLGKSSSRQGIHDPVDSGIS